ncbi:MAG: DUF2889 domain-containing protein [Burkholderiaceae bacterium]
MSLPAPECERVAAHRRSITVQAYQRTDGLWDIEGHLADAWPTPVPKAGSTLAPGQPMHSMWLRLTVDSSATIVGATAAVAAGPYDEACAAIAPDYSKLIGVRVAGGYRSAVRQLLGRTAGCTHMNELAGVMGSAVLQAMWEVLTSDSDDKPFAVDGCHALKASGPQVAKFFPKWFQPNEH